MIDLTKVYTAPEAAEIWGVVPDTVKQACQNSASGKKANPFLPHEYRKSKGTWLVSHDGMVRLYGEPKNKEDKPVPTKITSLEGLEYHDLRPASEEDEQAIQKHLDREIELRIDDQLRVWSSADIYIADLVKA